jgi:predicted MFS family arabinose efflux permease
MLMVGSLGMVASTLPVQWLIPLTGWRPIFLALGGLMVLAMGLIAWQVPPWKKAAETMTPLDPAEAGYSLIWKAPQFRMLVPIGFFNYGGLVAMQTLWAAPWMVKVAGYTPAQAAMGLFWINVAMLLTFLAWGSANPWLARKGYTIQRLITYGTPLSFAMLAIILIAGPAITTGTTVLWLLYFVSGTVGAQAQPAVGMAFKAELAGRALSAFNLVIFLGVFAVQWGVGLLIDGFRSGGWDEVAAFQGALAVYGVCCVASYLYFLAAKKP